jgi:siroheme synthase
LDFAAAQPPLDSVVIAARQGGKNKLGKVYLIGAGPGDPGLLTVEALRILEIADVVIQGVENREHIAENLIRMGRAPAQPVAFIEHLVEQGSASRQRVIETSLAAVAAGQVEVEPPAVIVMGEVVRLRSRWTRAREVTNQARCA